MKNVYKERNATLQKLGYKSYDKYLNSPLWKSIRGQKLKEKPNCYCCDKTATQVHHMNYKENVLLGQDLKYDDLISICAKCHYKSEFKGQKKRSSRDTNGIVNSKHNHYDTIISILRNKYNKYLQIDKSNDNNEYHVSIDGEYLTKHREIETAIILLTRKLEGQTIRIDGKLVNLPKNINQSPKSIKKILQKYAAYYNILKPNSTLANNLSNLPIVHYRTSRIKFQNQMNKLYEADKKKPKRKSNKVLMDKVRTGPNRTAPISMSIKDYLTKKPGD